MKKNLFQAVKTFINNTEVGTTFTTKHLIEMVGDNEIPSRWKTVNSNPYYRTHTYKAYLRRTGFLSNPKRGQWTIEKHIPDFITLGTIEFLIGYGNNNYNNNTKTYNGLTRAEIIEKINNSPVKNIEMEHQTSYPSVIIQKIDELKTLVKEQENQDIIRIFNHNKEKINLKENIMKITQKTLMVNFETEVKIGRNDAIEATLVHQAFIYRDKNDVVDVEIESVDTVNVKFLGIAIEESYSAFKEFKATMLTLGVDVNKLLNEKELEISKSGVKDNLKLMFGDKI
jgi:hypothetical protein